MYLVPDGASDVIYAGNGNDFVVGGLGNDIIFEGRGTTRCGDDLNIPQGNDNLIDGGNDIYAYNAGDGSDGIYDRITMVQATSVLA